MMVPLFVHFVVVSLCFIVVSKGERFESCGRTHGCFGAPIGCGSPEYPCTSMIMYRAVNASTIEVRLVNKIDKSMEKQYVAMGLSVDKGMGNDMVYQCVYARSFHEVQFAASENVKNYQNNKPIEQFRANGTLFKPSENSAVDDYFTCSAFLPVNFKCNPGPKSIATQLACSSAFGTLNQPFYILLAIGAEPVLGETNHIQQEAFQLWKHDSNPRMSSKRINLFTRTSASETSLVGAKSRRRLIVAHGALMLLAFWLINASAVLSARYLRSSWPLYTIFGHDVWFFLHRTFNQLFLMLLTAATILIFYSSEGRLLVPEGSYTRFHTICGITVIVCSYLQAFVAYVRCDHYSEKRVLFDWFHKVHGTATWLLGTAAIFLTSYIDSSNLTPTQAYGSTPRMLMIAYIAVTAAVSIALEVHVMLTERCSLMSAYRTRGGIWTQGRVNGPRDETIELRHYAANKRTATPQVDVHALSMHHPDIPARNSFVTPWLYSIIRSVWVILHAIFATAVISCLIVYAVLNMLTAEGMDSKFND